MMPCGMIDGSGLRLSVDDATILYGRDLIWDGVHG
jgi:hypothetical protein